MSREPDPALQRRSRWHEISELLDEVLDLEEPARERWLSALAERAPALVAEVRALLAEQKRLSGAFVLDGDPTAPLVGAGLAGQRLGAYTLECVLGHGGMGTVWLARRSDGRFEGRAAVKLLSAALLGRPSEQRFVREGSVLAKLHHANIAQLIDAGVAPGGQPYLVLEYVDGERIDAYAERRGMSVEARVRLFLDVLAAVAHAHSHLIVHRDLKPSNILVTGGGVVKLLDFGVAALLGGNDAERTREGDAALTPEYAAPEQLLGAPVTTATDVYALGLVLFVLLVGRHPIDTAGKSAPELARITLERDAPTASQTVQDAGRERALRGDLDNIVARALKKNPLERYSSAELLAQDLRRYLAHEPVSARPDRLGYRAAKFVRRHRGGVVTGVITAVALVAATVVTTTEMLEARHQRDAAIFQSRRAQYQARFAYQIMSEVGTDERPITIRELIRTGIEVLEKNYADDPRFMIAALINISGRFMDLGDTDDEYRALVQAEGIARRLGDPGEIASVQCNTVETELQAGRPRQAAERMRDGLANLARVYKPDFGTRIACDTAQARLSWGQGEIPRAITQARQVALSMEANHMQDDVRYGTVVSMLEILLGESGQVREALQWNRRDIQALERSGRARTVSMSAARHNQAIELYDLGEISAAYRQEKQVVQEIASREGARSVPPPIAQRLGFLQVRVEESDAGLAWIEQGLRQAQAQKNVPAEVGALLSRARAQLALGRRALVLTDVEAAERLMQDQDTGDTLARQTAQLVRAQLLLANDAPASALAAADGLLKELGYPRTRTSVRLPLALILRARAQSALSRPAEALQTAREALAVAEEHSLDKDESADVGAALMELAIAQRTLGDLAGARVSAQRAAGVLSRSLGPTHSETRAAQAFPG